MLKQVKLQLNIYNGQMPAFACLQGIKEKDNIKQKQCRQQTKVACAKMKYPRPVPPRPSMSMHRGFNKGLRQLSISAAN